MTRRGEERGEGAVSRWLKQPHQPVQNSPRAACPRPPCHPRTPCTRRPCHPRSVQRPGAGGAPQCGRGCPRTVAMASPLLLRLCWQPAQRPSAREPGGGGNGDDARCHYTGQPRGRFGGGCEAPPSGSEGWKASGTSTEAREGREGPGGRFRLAASGGRKRAGGTARPGARSPEPAAWSPEPRARSTEPGAPAGWRQGAPPAGPGSASGGVSGQAAAALRQGEAVRRELPVSEGKGNQPRKAPHVKLHQPIPVFFFFF